MTIEPPYRHALGNRFGGLLALLVFLAVFSFALIYGFVLSTQHDRLLVLLQYGLVTAFGGCYLYRIFSTDEWRQRIWENLCETILLILLAFTVIIHLLVRNEVIFPFLNAYPFMMVSAQGYLAFAVVKYLFHYTHHIMQSLPPAKAIALSFIAVIVVGALLLLLPVATHGTLRPNISPLDAFFTSTSAVCVTGLIVVDTETVFSRFGQVVIMVLIQIGAFGIMVAAGMFAVGLSGKSGYRGKVIMKDILQTEGVGAVRSMLLTILFATLLFESVFALFLYHGFRGHAASEGAAAFHAVFHAVSAFCNAGLSTFSSGLEQFTTSAFIIYPVMALIILGGIGFPVIHDVSAYITNRIRRKKLKHSLNIHTRLVLRITLLLIVLGFIITLLGGDWQDKGWLYAFDASLFQSVTTRTAGFNTIPLATLSTWTLTGFMVLMMIGAAPGGTAGGIKVSTVGLLYYATKNMMRGRAKVELMNRTVPMRLIESAFVISGLSVTYVALAVMLLTVTEPDKDFFHLVFEAASAFGTVGLSLGVTPNLSALGKCVIILTMFLGRIGPLTLFLAVTDKRDEASYEYPVGKIIVG